MIHHASSFVDVVNVGSTWGRWFKALPLALVTTIGLVVGMERLISSAPVTMAPLADYVLPDIVMPVREPVVERDTKPVKPKDVEPVPATPAPLIDLEPGPRTGIVPPAVVKQTPPPSLGGFSSNVPIPTVMVQADYPHRALSRGIEGYVEVEFDVTKTGATENSRVVAANPERLFEKAALRAVKNWKYAPVTVNGEAQAYKGMLQRLVFEIEKG